MRTPLLVPILVLLPLAAPAQRATAKLALADREVAIEYGVVRSSKHSLQELPVGGEWRMGNNDASVLRTQLPLVCGEVVVAPGSYRLAISRKGEKELALQIVGAAAALGGKSNLLLDGTFSEIKPVEALALEWSPLPAKGKKDPELTTKLLVRYATCELTIPIKIIGARPGKLAGATIDVFSYEPAWLDARLKSGAETPLLSIKSAGERKDKKSPESFSLIAAGEAKCSFIPSMVAPTDSFGFGEVKAPDAAYVVGGTLALAAAQTKKPTLEPEKLERSPKGELTLRLAFGEKVATATISDPTKK